MHVKQRMVNDKSKEQLRRDCTDVKIYFVYAAIVHSLSITFGISLSSDQTPNSRRKAHRFCNGDSVGQVFLVQNESTKAIAHSA